VNDHKIGKYNFTQQLNACMKADDGHFKYRIIVYFVVQIMTNFMCTVTKYDASFVLQTFREHQK